jgi:hypothetical protein
MTPIHQSCNNVTCLIPTRSAHNWYGHNKQTY